MRKLFRIILYGIITSFLALLMSAAYPSLVLLLPDGGFQTSLDPAFAPTAEFLIQHPMPTPEFISYVNPAPGSTLDGTTKFCVGVIPNNIPGAETTRKLNSEDFPSHNAAFGARIIVNNLVLPRNSVDIFVLNSMIPFKGHLWIQVDVCTAPPLEDGLHLIEISMEGSPRTFTYTWAYKTEANFATPPAN